MYLVKKVVTTVSQFGDYIDEIQQSYELGFTPYILHTNPDGTLVTPIRFYDGHVYVLDDETTMKVTTGQIVTDRISSKLIYFVKVAGSRGPSLVLQEPKVLLERLVRWDRLEHMVVEEPLVHLDSKGIKVIRQ